jgi:hypothetical protein
MRTVAIDSATAHLSPQGELARLFTVRANAHLTLTVKVANAVALIAARFGLNFNEPATFATRASVTGSIPRIASATNAFDFFCHTLLFDSKHFFQTVNFNSVNLAWQTELLSTRGTKHGALRLKVRRLLEIGWRIRMRERGFNRPRPLGPWWICERRRAEV